MEEWSKADDATTTTVAFIPPNPILRIQIYRTNTTNNRCNSMPSTFAPPPSSEEVPYNAELSSSSQQQQQQHHYQRSSLDGGSGRYQPPPSCRIPNTTNRRQHHHRFNKINLLRARAAVLAADGRRCSLGRRVSGTCKTRRRRLGQPPLEIAGFEGKCPGPAVSRTNLRFWRSWGLTLRNRAASEERDESAAKSEETHAGDVEG